MAGAAYVSPESMALLARHSGLDVMIRFSNGESAQMPLWNAWNTMRQGDRPAFVAQFEQLIRTGEYTCTIDRTMLTLRGMHAELQGCTDNSLKVLLVKAIIVFYLSTLGRKVCRFVSREQIQMTVGRLSGMQNYPPTQLSQYAKETIARACFDLNHIEHETLPEDKFKDADYGTEVTDANHKLITQLLVHLLEPHTSTQQEVADMKTNTDRILGSGADWFHKVLCLSLAMSIWPGVEFDLRNSGVLDRVAREQVKQWGIDDAWGAWRRPAWRAAFRTAPWERLGAL